MAESMFIKCCMVIQVDPRMDLGRLDCPINNLIPYQPFVDCCPVFLYSLTKLVIKIKVLKCVNENCKRAVSIYLKKWNVIYADWGGWGVGWSWFQYLSPNS